MNKKSLQENFKGFKVIEVVGEKVALLSSDKHEPHVSTAVKDNGEIVEGVKTAVNATVVFGEGESEIKFSLNSIIDLYAKEIEELTQKLKANEETITALSKANERMEKQETERRKCAVKTSIKNRFEEIKANSEAEYSDNECDELLTEEKVNAFIQMEDKDGKFIGDSEAVKAVDALCMDKIIKAHKMRENAARKNYAWDMPESKAQDNSTDDVERSIDKYSNR